MSRITSDNPSDPPKHNTLNQCVCINTSEKKSQDSVNHLYINKMNYFAKKRINLYKTEMCRSFEEVGICKYGDRCQFAHSASEIRRIDRHPRYKTETCRTFWEEGTCPYGKRCCFIHLERDLNNILLKDIDVTPVPLDCKVTEINQEVDELKFIDGTNMSESFSVLGNNHMLAIPNDSEILIGEKSNYFDQITPSWNYKPFWETNESLHWCLAKDIFCYIKFSNHRAHTKQASNLAPGAPMPYRCNIKHYQYFLDRFGL